jgi:multidrug resistance efflux pump
VTQPRSWTRRLADQLDPRVAGPSLLFWAAWAAAAWGAWTLHKGWAGPRVGPGSAEIVEYRITAKEPQAIVHLAVEPGDMVRAGDLLVEQDPQPLAAELSVVAAELAAAEAELHAQELSLGRERLTEERDFDRLVDEAELGLLSARMETDRDRADLAGVEQRLRWWHKQVDQQFVGADKFEDLKGQAEALKQRIALRQVAEATWQSKIAEMRNKRQQFAAHAPPRPPQLAGRELEPHRAAMQVAAARRDQILKRMALLTVRSPVSGVVAQVLAREGEWLGAGLPAVILRDPQPHRVQAYLASDQLRDIDPGDLAIVQPRDGSNRRLRGVVQTLAVGVDTQPGQMPLGLYGKQSWSSHVWIKLADTGLRPGELVDVLLVDQPGPTLPQQPARQLPAGPAEKPAPATPLATPVSATAATGPEPLQVPDSLTAQSQFEPSGWVWIPSWQHYLCVSDDTGPIDADGHPPWLFLVDRLGKVQDRLVKLDGIAEVSDLEAISLGPDGQVWLLSSQSVSQKGKRPLARTWLLRAQLQGTADAPALKLTGQWSLASALGKLSVDAQLQLGLLSREPGFKKGVAGFDRLLDIEGLSWAGDDLILALKSPTAASGAVLWRLRQPQRFVGGDKAPALGQGDLERLPPLPLRGGPLGADGPAGLSDAVAVGPGQWLLLAVAEVKDDVPKIGSSLWLATLDEGGWKTQRLADFAGVHAEGVALSDVPGVAAIVFDEGRNVPLWQRVALPRRAP